MPLGSACQGLGCVVRILWMQGPEAQSQGGPSGAQGQGAAELRFEHGLVPDVRTTGLARLPFLRYPGTPNLLPFLDSPPMGSNEVRPGFH